MPGGTQRTKSPNEYVVAGEWPHVVLEDYRPARVAQHVSRALREAMTYREISANALSKASEVNRQCIANVLQGRVWADMLTIASFEDTLKIMLWPVGEAEPIG